MPRWILGTATGRIRCVRKSHPVEPSPFLLPRVESPTIRPSAPQQPLWCWLVVVKSRPAPFPSCGSGHISNSSEHLRQIGADQVTALVQVRAVLFRAVAPCSRVTTTNVESAIGSTHSVRTRGGNTRKADNTHTADRRRSLGSTSIVATASRRDRYRPHLV